MTLEDESGVVNVVVWPRVTEAYRRTVLAGRLVLVRGRIQRTDEIVHLVADKLEDITPWLALLVGETAATPLGGAASTIHTPAATPVRHPRDERAIPRSRDFR